jgi:hypothetical protein
MTIFSKHISLSEELSVKILSNRSTARLLFDKTQKTFWSEVILDFTEIEFASKSFLDELNALIKQQDEKTYAKENMAEEVKKMDELVQHSQDEKPWNSQEESNKKADMVAI